ncbi:hypothetical protein [Rubritalea profundi]|uniref:hypothetical protein n=1 Tax=Rubritalea profundi TaxID=1658618 RepID=UPI00101ADD61|nr:hypothetical protein [Rubritalea profundi]
MRSPVLDAAFFAAEGFLERAVGAVVHDVVAAVAIEHEEVAVRGMESPGWAVLAGLFVFSGSLGPRPLVENFTGEGGFENHAAAEIGEVEDFAIVLDD